MLRKFNLGKAIGQVGVMVTRRLRKSKDAGPNPVPGFVSILRDGEQVFFPKQKNTEWKPFKLPIRISPAEFPEKCPRCKGANVKLLIHSQTWLCVNCRYKENATDEEMGNFTPA